MSEQGIPVKITMHVCAECWYYDSRHALCRRHAPAVRNDRGTTTKGRAFPAVHPDDWCGEWADKGQPPANFGGES